MSSKLRNISCLQPMFAVRDWLMSKSGLFNVKAKIKRTLFLKRLVREDEAQKRDIEKRIMEMSDRLLPQHFSDSDIVVSITSYGKRVCDALPYTLYSLLTQTKLPSKVAVFLDRDNWSDENLPPLLEHLKIVGIEFYYCEDIKSYKKLIPALKMFPSNPIITMDDDFYYNTECIRWITEAYNQSDKQTVLGQWGCIPEKCNGRYIPYNEWKDCKYGDSLSPISFFGCCCCYPPHIFDGEIFRDDVFMKLCPSADDIWFWAMEERQNIKRAYISPQGHGYHTSVNRIEEYDWSQKGTLMYQNVVEGKNNAQLRAVLDYYHLDL